MFVKMDLEKLKFVCGMILVWFVIYDCWDEVVWDLYVVVWWIIFWF